jgi:hypothetical protein
MNNKYQKNYVRTFFLVVILFLYVTVFENDICGFIDYSYAYDNINIEVIYQPELPKEIQSYEDPFSFKQRKPYVPFHLEDCFKCRKRLLLSINNFSSSNINSQNKYSLAFHHIISILQKNNTWHQSSDEDTFLNDFC